MPLSEQRELLKQLASGNVPTTEQPRETRNTDIKEPTATSAEIFAETSFKNSPKTPPQRPKRKHKKPVHKQNSPDSPLPPNLWEGFTWAYSDPTAPTSPVSPTPEHLHQNKKCIKDLMQFLDTFEADNYKIYKLNSKLRSSDMNDAYDLRTHKHISKAKRMHNSTKEKVRERLQQQMHRIKEEKERWMVVYNNEIQIAQANLDELRRKRSEVMEMDDVLRRFEHGGFCESDEVLAHIAACRPFP
jgi:hypothetical protein